MFCTSVLQGFFELHRQGRQFSLASRTDVVLLVFVIRHHENDVLCLTYQKVDHAEIRQDQYHRGQPR